MRKAIDELGAAAARDRIARAIWVERENIDFFWNGDLVELIRIIEGPGKRRDLTIDEHKLLARAGVFQVPGGWEIEEEVAIKPGDLFRPKQGGPVKRVVGAGPFDARDRGVRRWALTLQHPGESHIVGSSELETDLLDPAKWERVAAEPAKPRLRASAALRKAIAAMIDPDDARAVSERQDAAIDKACNDFVLELRAELAPRPSPSPRTTDGALTAYLLANYRDEWRTDDTAETLAIRLLGETQRIVDEAHREAERSDEAAKELAAELAKVRAERDRNGQGWAEAAEALDKALAKLESADASAEVAERLAREATAELAKVRAELNAANGRAAEAERGRVRAVEMAGAAINNAVDGTERAERERDEARADLATLRGLCRGFCAKVGVPHG